VLTHIIGPFLSLLPQRWRKYLFEEWSIDWVRATLISGVLCGFGGMMVLVAWYLYAIQAATEPQLDPTMQATKGVPGYGAGMVVGFASYVAFLMHPLTWVLGYFTFEGIYRGFAALVNAEAPGSGPLVLADWIVRTRQQRSYERRVPLVTDKVTADPAGKQWNLKVESCRPKPLWKFTKVIKFKEDFYQVIEETAQGATPARPHVYLLRNVPAGEAYRGMEIYDPNEPLRPQEPTAGQAAVRAFRDGLRLKTLPLVADEVERLVNDDGVFLRITSCRPKEDWIPGRVIRNEGCFYRMAETYDAEPPRPFGFVLQLLPAGIASRRIIDYSPDDVLKQPNV